MKRANGTGSVYKLSGNRRNKWVAAVSYYDENDNYKRKRKAIGYFRIQKDALAALETYNANPYSLADITFAQAYEQWSEKGLSKGSQQRKTSYAAAYKKCSALYDMNVRDIKLIHLQDVIDSLEGMSKSTMNNVKIVISTVFEYCIKYEYISKNYAEFIEFPDAREANKKRIFSDLEIKKLWDVQENDTAAMILILIYTGYRINELLQMPKSNIKLKDGYIVGGKKTKAGKGRVVPIHHLIQPLISRLIKKSQGFAFYDHSYLTFKRAFEKLMSSLGMIHTIHETRHTFASLLDRSEVKESVTKRLMGHSFGNITQDVYIHKELNELRNGIEKIKIS